MAAPSASADWTAQQQAVDTAQAVERAQFAQALKTANPGTYNAYVAGNATALADAATAAKRAAFAKAYLDAGRYADMDRNAAGYDQRSGDVATMQAALAPDAQVAAMASDLATSRRQWEVNEWAYESKREALFWLQLVLMALLAATVLAFAARSGLVSQAVLRTASISLAVVVLGVGAYRYHYTSVTRDRRFWSKRRFPLPATSATGAPSTCGAPTAFTSDPNSLLPASVTQCASQLAGGVAGLESTLTNEAAAAQSSSVSASVCGVPV
jgi:hypothetical protein